MSASTGCRQVGEDKHLISLEMFQVREKERERAAGNCCGGRPPPEQPGNSRRTAPGVVPAGLLLFSEGFNYFPQVVAGTSI